MSGPKSTYPTGLCYFCQYHITISLPIPLCTYRNKLINNKNDRKWKHMKKAPVPANPARHLSACVGVCGRQMYLSGLFRELLGDERHRTLSFGDRCHSLIYFLDQSRCVSISLIFASHVLRLTAGGSPTSAAPHGPPRAPSIISRHLD